MKRAFLLHASLALVAFFSSRPLHAAATRRFAVAAGVNRGASDRVPLRYAVADAERFAQVIMRMGGVSAVDLTLLREPSRQAFLDALTAVGAKTTNARAGSDRTEVLVYFSGHADEKGLMLGRETLDYRDLRSALHRIGADVGIAVLDACASGAITRLKGGRTHPAFLSDLSTQVQGYAFLTSSSENEAAQESDRLQGSYFTHALLSGMRGAADVSGDGKVTLGEAYQFAFGETLAATTTTQAGAQHPSWDIKMAGTGDVVLTDVRQTSTSLLLGTELDGRFFVHNQSRQLVAELYKPAGRTVELGLEPGEYEVHYEQEPALLRTRIALAEGQSLTLDRSQFKPARRVPTRRRGPSMRKTLQPYVLDGRSRASMSFGLSSAKVSVRRTWDDNEDVNVGGGECDFAFTHWVREDVALDVSIGGTRMGVRTTRLPDGEEVETSGLFYVLCGARYYPPIEGSFRPYLSASLGPMTDIDVRTFTPTWSDQKEETDVTDSGTSLGARVGGGVDLLLSRRFHLGLYSGTVLRSGYKSRLGVGMSLGWTWGRGRAR
jgi:uncharacterized caspase-like protein